MLRVTVRTSLTLCYDRHIIAIQHAIKTLENSTRPLPLTGNQTYNIDMGLHFFH